MPDAPTLALVQPRLLPAPLREPPYDQTQLPDRTQWPDRTGPVPAAQGTLALTFVLDSGVPAVPARLRPAPAPEDFGPRRSSATELPDPHLWAARLAQAAVEVMTGTRPPAQLRRWTSDEVYARLRRAATRGRLAERARSGGGRQRRAVVRAVRVGEPTDGVAEVAAVVDDGRRAHALVMRLEGADGRWRCTHLDRV